MQLITPAHGFWAILSVIGGVWLRSGLKKIESGEFVSNLDQTLTFFASKNPYPWYKWLLTKVAIPNSQAIGLSMQWSEVLVGAAIVGLVIAYALWAHLRLPLTRCLIFPVLVALGMNLLFWLAAGWTSPSTDTVNLVMMAIEGIVVMVLVSHAFYVKSLS